MTAIDVEAINDLYDYGGEQGKKHTEKENKMEDFENDILDLASLCIAAMDRVKPTDPIVYSDNTELKFKKPFVAKFGN
jgi:hypothetical protein